MTEERDTCLAIGRKAGQSFIVSGRATIHIVKIGKGNVRVQIEAPKETRIVRSELLDKKGETDVL